MVKRSAAQRQRATVPRDPATYGPALASRLRMMSAAAKRWDDTRDPEEVVVMAVALRTMLIDRLVDRVISLKRALFFDSANEIPPHSGIWIGSGGLTSFQMGDGPTRCLPLCQIEGWSPVQRFARFNSWWSVQQPVVLNELRVSRYFLIDRAADTDGAHVAQALDVEYSKLMSPAEGISFSDSRPEVAELHSVGPAAVRQIAWEVERTLTVALASKQIGLD